MSDLETFDNLLRRLGDQHELEVRLLREQVVQLQKEARRGQSPPMLERTKDETTVSTADPALDDEKVSPRSFAPMICQPVQFHKPAHELIINGNLEPADAPDPDALEAAFAVAMDDNSDIEDVLEEIAHKVAHDRCQDHTPRNSLAELLPSPLPVPQNYQQPKVNSSEWWGERGSRDVNSGKWPPGGDADQVGPRCISREEVHTRFNSERKDERLTISTSITSSIANVQDDHAVAMKRFERLETPLTPMGRWERLIDYARTVQFLQALPRVDPSWVEAAKESNAPNKSILGLGGMANFKSLIIMNNSTGGGNGKETGTSPNASLLDLTKRQSRPNIIIRTMQPFMMHPTCRRRVVWDIGGISLLLHDVIFIPIQQAFENGTEGLGAGYEKFLQVLDLFGASFWTLDIFVSFLTGFYSNEGFVDLSPGRVARHYLRSWFPLDMLIVSVDWCTMFIGMSAASGYMRLGKTVSRIMRVLRLLRFLKMNSTMRELMERINSEYLLQLVNLMKTLIFIVIINHYIACIWYMVGAGDFTSSAWTTKFLVNYPGEFSYAYATALHWSLTQFTPASMEVVPQNAVERFFTIFVIIMALVAFSSFVSSITAAMTHIRNINARQVQEEASIRQFFSEHKISHGTASRVWHFVRKHKGGNIKRLKEGDVPALKNLPHKIKEDLRLEIYLPIIAEHAFFNELHIRDKALLVKVVNTSISEKTIPIGEELFADCKQAIPALVFVGNGTLQYAPHIDSEEEKDREENEANYCFINRGEWACETALWADKSSIFGSFSAVNGPCELILLDARAFNEAMQGSSTCLLFAAKYAELFMDAFRDTCCLANESDQHEVEINLLFNEPAAISKFVVTAKESLGESNQRFSMPRGFPMLGHLSANL